jgi:hypothetical protein
MHSLPLILTGNESLSSDDSFPRKKYIRELFFKTRGSQRLSETTQNKGGFKIEITK